MKIPKPFWLVLFWSFAVFMVSITQTSKSFTNGSTMRYLQIALINLDKQR